MITQEQIDAAGPWFHSFVLPNGCRTKVGKQYHNPSLLWSVIRNWIPGARNNTALDIGCNGGFFSMQMCNLGYQVDAIDVEEIYLKQTQLVTQICGMDCETFEADIQTYRPDEQYNVVLCLGVVYHLKDIVSGIQNCLDAAKDFVIFESAVSSLKGSVIEFFNYEDGEYKWVSLPTREALEKIVKSCGGEIVAHTIYENRFVFKVIPRIWKQRPFKEEVSSLADNVGLKNPSNFIKVVI